MNFLDLIISVRPDGIIKTNLFVKPTDSASYLHFDSAHPSHCIKGIPYGQFLRIRRICSDKEDFNRHCILKGQHFVRRGYPVRLNGEAFLKALRKDRASLLEPKASTESEASPNILVTTYNPGFRGLKTVVDKNWDLLGKSCTTRAIHREQVIGAFKRPKNLRDYLMKARLALEKTVIPPDAGNRCLHPNRPAKCLRHYLGEPPLPYWFWLKTNPRALQ